MFVFGSVVSLFVCPGVYSPVIVILLLLFSIAPISAK